MTWVKADRRTPDLSSPELKKAPMTALQWTDDFALGVPQTLAASAQAATLEGGEQKLSLFAVASQLAIKQLGINGGDRTGQMAPMANVEIYRDSRLTAEDILSMGADHVAIATANRRAGDGDMVEIGPWRFKVLGIPGHTLSHIAFCSRNAGGEGLLFCGDTLFSLGCGRMFEGTPAQMLASLRKLAALPGDTRVCCAHEYTLGNLRFARAVEPGNQALADYEQHCQRLRAGGQPTLPSSIGTERAINPFLRSREPAVTQAVQARTPSATGDVAVFAALREWKNEFR